MTDDNRTFARLTRLENVVKVLKASVDEHEERLDIDDERLDHHEAMIAEVERDLVTLREVGVRLTEREHTRLISRRRRSRPRSDQG